MATAWHCSLPESLPRGVGETSRNACDQWKWQTRNPQAPTYVAQATGRSWPGVGPLPVPAVAPRLLSRGVRPTEW